MPKNINVKYHYNVYFQILIGKFLSEPSVSVYKNSLLVIN